MHGGRVQSKEIDCGETPIHCPACAARDVVGRIVQIQETLVYFLVIRVPARNTTWVDCSACHARLYSRVRPEELLESPANFLVGLLVPYVSLYGRASAVLSILLFWIPFANVAIGGTAVFINRQTPGWPRRASWVGLGLSIAVTAFMLILLALEAAGFRLV